MGNHGEQVNTTALCQPKTTKPDLHRWTLGELDEELNSKGFS